MAGKFKVTFRMTTLKSTNKALKMDLMTLKQAHNLESAGSLISRSDCLSDTVCHRNNANLMSNGFAPFLQRYACQQRIHATGARIFFTGDLGTMKKMQGLVKARVGRHQAAKLEGLCQRFGISTSVILRSMIDRVTEDDFSEIKTEKNGSIGIRQDQPVATAR